MTKILRFSIILLLIFVKISVPCCTNRQTDVVQLKVNGMENPLGIDRTPLFSWNLNSSEYGSAQTAYQIIVSSTPELLKEGKGDVWDSKKVESDQTIQIPFKGKPLSTNTYYWWKVKYWNENGEESEWSEPAYWCMGMMQASDWKAKWIGSEKLAEDETCTEQLTKAAARMVRKEYTIKKEIKNATSYICGLGLFEYYINGKKVGNPQSVLMPALSEYNKRAYYMTFDVTPFIKKGGNAFAVLLGNGRFFAPRPDNASALPRLIMQTEITYKDGSKETIISDETWKITTDGPIRANNEFDGEEYDANKEMPGWDQCGFDDSQWMQAELVASGSPVLQSMPMPAIAIQESVKPVKFYETKPGVYIFDMGQNMVGWVRLTVKGKKGTQVKMRFAETLNNDSSLYMANLRSAQVTDIYTLKGKGTEQYEPRFTYHGFRFVEVTGLPSKPNLSTIEGKVVYDQMDVIGSFTTSNETINTIYKNAYWGIRGNYRSMPTDCPQRDERQGWLGDRGTGCIGESFIFDNALLYAKWTQDIHDSQTEKGQVPDVAPTYWKIFSDNVSWPAAYLCATNMLYQQFANKEPIIRHYDSFKKWILYMKETYMINGLMPRDTYGDWCMPPERQELIHSEDPTRRTDGTLLGTSYYYYMLQLMQKFAKIAKHEEDIALYQSIRDTIYQGYNKAFFNEEAQCYSNNTVTANLLSLVFGLVPDQYKAAIEQKIVEKTEKDFNGHTSTGLIGAQWIMRELTKMGRTDIAYKFTTNTDYPSWGYMASQGATTIWELWNGNTADPAMNSGNHVMLLGDLIIWYYENLAGIKSDPDYPGFKKIIMRPTFPEELDFVNASYRSANGTIKSHWKRDEYGAYSWRITIPANTTATVYIPKLEKHIVTFEGIPDFDKYVKYIGNEEDYHIYSFAAGSYHVILGKMQE